MSDFSHKKKITTFLTHLLFICILFILPEVLTSLASPWRPPTPMMYGKAFLFIMIFYVNYFFLIEHCFSRRNGAVLKFVAWNLVLTVAAMTVTYIMWRAESIAPHPRPRRGPAPSEMQLLVQGASFLLRDFVMIVLTIGLSVALRMGDKWFNIEQRTRELAAFHREEELKNLKSQLNPHFLFNTLNSIYALIAISPVKAQNAVHELSRLLRYVLYENPTSVTVRQELEFVNNYVKLMKLRLNPSLQLNVTLDAGDSGDREIAPLLFITVIENVFKHGNTGNAGDEIDIAITAHDGRLECVTDNPISAATQDKSASGIGEQNLRRRLVLLYGDRASFVSRRENDRYHTELIINFNNTPNYLP